MTTNVSAEIVGGSLDGLTGNMSEAAITELKRQKTGGQLSDQAEKKKSAYIRLVELEMYKPPVFALQPKTFDEAASPDQHHRSAEMYDRGDLSHDFKLFNIGQYGREYERHLEAA